MTALVTVEHLPEALRSVVLNHAEAITAAIQTGQWDLPVLHQATNQQLAMVLACSDFVAKQLTDKPQCLHQLLAEKGVEYVYSEADYQQELAELAARADDEASLALALRQYRQLQMCRIIWRDVTGLADLQQTTAELSWLAEYAIEHSLQWHYAVMCADIGTPLGATSGLAQQLVVIGMGKLGAWELNLSSDIDLIFTYPESGQTEGGRRSISNHDFFIRLGQRLIKTLDELTGDGFVFRVDMRLRPHGQSGALAASFGAMEEYYHSQGREWERYAMVKARVVGGDRAAGKELMDTLRPFIYRRYLDFSAFDSLRDMKALINREVTRRQLAEDVKLGPGGIREVEFIAQAFQLIRGGRERQLQERRLLPVLQALAELSLLPPDVVSELTDGYRFLRNTEHAIQCFADQQTQMLPTDELQRLRIALIMGFADWHSFYHRLSRYREQVSRHFADVIAPAQSDDTDDDLEQGWIALWEGVLDDSSAVQWLAQQGYDDATESWRLISALLNSRRCQMMQKEGRERLNKFLPVLLSEIASANSPSLLLERVLPLVEAVLRRTAYLMLLLENTGAREQLLILCGASPWIADQLARHPVLLDELVNTSTLYAVPEHRKLASELGSELRQQVLRLEWDDLEGHMEALRYFRASHVLRIAANEVTDRMPLMKVSDYLTFLAEVILQHVLELCWRNLVAKHGRPLRLDGTPCDTDFLILGYGKLGGIEMGHGSDLDLVFVHDGDNNASTDGDKPVPGQLFFNRLGQRMIHVLTAATTMGPLYEVDMRLRPSGNSGLLVTSLKALSQYQQNEAWTWEHQALVRARPVAGDNKLAEAFLVMRKKLLCQARDETSLRAEVAGMREKMRKQLLAPGAESGENAYFDLKHAAGGIVDIEFMVQFAVLAWAHQSPALTRYSDNIRILETLAESGLLSAAEVHSLIEAYKAYRTTAHRLALQQLPGRAAADNYVQQREQVSALWSKIIEHRQN
ncbi:MAG: bifunctional [glutamate--ammonia ligase]-adenylyl-L-tyrosine phosphorylase/[glutamate--ammonia-ligase] adenylyltransferase [Pseudomonadales bacterium]